MAQLRQVKRMATAAGTFAFALAIGYVMQYDGADAARVAGQSPSSARLVLPAQLDESPLKQLDEYIPKLAMPIVQRRTGTDEDLLRVDPSSVKLTALVAEAAAARPDPTPETEKVTNTPSCDINLSTAIGEDALVVLTVFSPCRTTAPFQVQHNEMTFSAVTDDLGQASIAVPALSVNVSLFISFEDGGGATATAVVPEAENVNRVVVQWKDVFAEMVQPADIESAKLGTVKRLGARTGDAASFAEVFTFPASLSARDGLAGLTVQAPVSDATCGQTLRGQAFHTIQGEEADPKDFQITLPGCEQVGTFLELKKILGGQTLLLE